MNKKFKVKLSKPFHGWLPVEINFNDTILKFEASDVPIDPLHLLINALDSVLCHSGAEVWWHLEPAGYYMTINNIGDEFVIHMEYSNNSKKQNRKHIFKFVGNFNNTILPIWRTLKKFYSHQYLNSDWPECDSRLMDNLTLKIKNHSNKQTINSNNK